MLNWLAPLHTHTHTHISSWTCQQRDARSSVTSTSWCRWHASLRVFLSCELFASFSIERTFKQEADVKAGQRLSALRRPQHTLGSFKVRPGDHVQHRHCNDCKYSIKRILLFKQKWNNELTVSESYDQSRQKENVRIHRQVLWSTVLSSTASLTISSCVEIQLTFLLSLRCSLQTSSLTAVHLRAWQSNYTIFEQHHRKKKRKKKSRLCVKVPDGRM